MLEAFKRKAPDDLHALIASSREERAALSTMLAQIQLHAAKLAAAGRTFQDLEARLPGVEARVAALAGRIGAADEAAARTRGALEGTGELASRLAALASQVEAMEARQRELAANAETLEAHARQFEAASRRALAEQGVRLETDRRVLGNLHGTSAAIAARLEDVQVQMGTTGEPRASVSGVLDAVSELAGLVAEAQSALAALRPAPPPST